MFLSSGTDEKKFRYFFHYGNKIEKADDSSLNLLHFTLFICIFDPFLFSFPMFFFFLLFFILKTVCGKYFNAGLYKHTETGYRAPGKHKIDLSY